MTDARPFHFKHFSLYHHRSTMKVGTDAILLGRWVEVKPEDVALDIGTGCGLLPLMLSQKGVSYVDAVDIDQASVEEASINFEASQWRERLKVYCMDINMYKPERRYDLIVSNPPYFNRFSKCDSERKSRARHNDMTLSYKSLCASAGRLLKPFGRFALVLPVSASAEFLIVAEHSGLFLRKRMTIIPIEGREPNRLNLEFGLSGCEKIQEEKFVIRNADKQFTQQYRDFLKDFYLGL